MSNKQYEEDLGIPRQTFEELEIILGKHTQRQ